MQNNYNILLVSLMDLAPICRKYQVKKKNNNHKKKRAFAIRLDAKTLTGSVLNI